MRVTITRWRRQKFERWTKDRSAFVLFTDGRHGPGWLHRLVFTMARNLGMVGHPRTVARAEQFERIYTVRDDLPVFDAMRRAVIAASNYYDVNPDRLEVIAGPDALDNLTLSIPPEAIWDLRGPFVRRERDGTDVFNVLNVDGRVIPDMSGWAVILKRPDRASDRAGQLSIPDVASVQRALNERRSRDHARHSSLRGEWP